MAKPTSYILKNVSKYDINLSDLGIRIPLGKSKDLLSPALNIKWENIVKSKLSGSIGLRLKKGFLVEMEGVVATPKPLSKAEVIREAVLVKFPDRTKSSIIIDLGNISEDIEKMSISEDDELLKQLDIEAMMNGEENLIVRDSD